MKIGIHLAQLSFPGGPATTAAQLGAAARAADEGGADTVTMMDHWFQMERFGGSAEPMLEGYTSLGYLAGITKRVELGLLVTGVTYRHPGLLAKIVATLDVLSEGRALLGLGAAWYEEEHAAYGVPFPPLKERFERLEETLQICAQMYSDDDGPYRGTHYELAETICNPLPLQRPRVMIGGSGERKTLRFVAKYGDACNLFDIGADGLRHKLEVLDGHCEREGRDPAEISRTLIAGHDPLGDTDAFLSAMEGYSKMGFDQVWLGPGPDDPAAWVTRVCEDVLPRLHEL
jgi:F420-dependent oxidoreductase-like protein